MLATLHALRALGVRISMDDFGTGYSSLSYLRSFPFDKIKIDQSFVRDLGSNRDAQAIVRSIISLGMGLGVTITAEGVETEAELSCLRAEGCHEGQGFLFSRARPNAEIVELAAGAARRGVRRAGGCRRGSRAGGVKAPTVIASQRIDAKRIRCRLREQSGRKDSFALLCCNRLAPEDELFRAPPCACSDDRSAPAPRSGAAPAREHHRPHSSRMLRLPP